MAPSNFRTYEAQSRLLAAVIASSPSLKLNFKEIAKYFGESTPMGIEFQFRAIRKEAKALREAVDKGESPLTTRNKMAATESFTRKRKTPAAASRVAGGSVLATPKKRARTAEVVLSNEEDGSGASEVNYDELDVTPVSTPAARPAMAAATASSPSSVIELVDDDDSNEYQHTPIALVTPSTSAYVPDATPALSTGVGATPPDESPYYYTHTAAADERQNTAPRTVRGGNDTRSSGRSAWAHELKMSFFKDEDDDNDEQEEEDDVFIVDTPSKTPKMEPGVSSRSSTVSATAVPFAPASTGTAGRSLNEYDIGGSSSSNSWDVHSHGHSQGQTDFSFGSSDAWTQPDFFHGADAAGYPPAVPTYDDDEAI